MKTIGIKLADGSFYPILEEGTAKSYQLDLTTVKDGQTKVQIDLYRSESGTMEDAQYVDTLEVSNLIPHPNGEAELHLSLALNENNELDAKVVDEETGKQSETSVTLVSRTLAERAEPTNFELSDSPEKEENTETLTQDFLTEPQDTFSAPEEQTIEEPTVKEPDFSDDFTGEAVDLADFDFSADEGEENSITAPQTAEDAEDVPFSFDSEIAKQDAEDVEAETVEEGAVPTETVEAEPETVADFAAETVADEPFFSTNEQTDNFNAETIADTLEEPQESPLPQIDDEMFNTSSFTSEADETDGIVYKTGAESSVPTEPADFADDVTATTDFSETAEPTGTEDVLDTTDVADTPSEDYSDEFLANEAFELPDFDNLDSTSTETDEPKTEGLTGYFDDPAFKDDPVFNEPDLNTSSSPAMDFSDLYDQETLDGKSTVYEDEENEEKKTHVPMIVCIICAIICVIATVLVLFVVPSKYNLIKGRNISANEVKDKVIESPAEVPAQEEETQTQSPVEIQIEEEPPVPSEVEETAPQAVEDQIVVAPEPEVVVPAVPPVAETQKAKDVKYRIRWGDTLWDIADAYYKNPWRYPKIARYNKIKNPDKIIAGTDIFIPVE